MCIRDRYSIIADFKGNNVNEKNIGIAVSRLHRILEILKVLVQQISILETMTPLDFLDFRNYLFPASGFQSFQFREFEVLLGLKEDKRHTYNNKPYAVVFDDKKKEVLQELENNKSLFQLVERWLERTPFLELSGFNFIEEYRKALENMLNREKKAIEETDVLSGEFKELRLKMLGDTKTYFANILDENYHNTLITEGKVVLSYRATVAALFISLYRDEPILHLPFKLLSALIDVDDHITTWRSRHAQMVMRMLGKKVGTGGSSGHEYLSETEPFLFSARYFRAQMLAANLKSRLETSFGSDWFENKESFEFLSEIWKSGQQLSAEETSVSYSGREILDADITNEFNDEVISKTWQLILTSLRLSRRKRCRKQAR